jgi:uncharacterized protein (TIGR02246 family)
MKIASPIQTVADHDPPPAGGTPPPGPLVANPSAGTAENGRITTKAVIALGALLLAFGLPALATDDVVSLVKEFNAQYDKAWNTLDAHKLAEQCSRDAVVLPPTVPAGTGTEAVLAFFEPLFKSKWADHRLEPITARRSGDNIIVAASRWTANFTDAIGKTTGYHGDVAQVFERTNGRWKLKLASWNVLPDAK